MRQRHDSHGTTSSDDQRSGSIETSSDDKSDDFSSEGSSDDKSVAFSDASSESLSDEEKQAAPLRVYDARFKIPAHNTLGELMKAKGKD